jgi:hypothetical protein
MYSDDTGGNYQLPTLPRRQEMTHPYENMTDPDSQSNGLYHDDKSPRTRDDLRPDGTWVNPDAELAVKGFDAQSFMRAQSEFIRAQAYFIEVGIRQADPARYLDHLQAFNRAQNLFLRAQSDFMLQHGVL